MPVTTQVTVVHILTKINVDMESMTVFAHFSRTVNGVPDGSVDFTIVGQDMIDLLNTQAVADQSLGAEITDAVYRLAIAKGMISGTIS